MCNCILRRVLLGIVYKERVKKFLVCDGLLESILFVMDARN